MPDVKINADNDVDVDDETMEDFCDKITFAAGVTAKDKRLKDTMPNNMREENIKKMKKPGDNSGSDTSKYYGSSVKNLFNVYL